ncbi:tail fiber domain-containing protein [Chryseobacterium sp. MYb264]|uniref:tail fiber domain-containing protein n=1 Tax=Chryseobacterium sp. MYb264 TaxID=2745153 RepID=UPI002E13A36E|nr:tail fiber domain-containing protein [Chryseobacterium sp. MYb264]
MKLTIITIILGVQFTCAQVGVNTINPGGVFHVDGGKDNPPTGAISADQQENDFVIMANGNIGVGTTAPIVKVDVNGVLQVKDTDALNRQSHIRIESREGVRLTLQATNSGSPYGKKGILGTATDDDLVFVYENAGILVMNDTGLFPAVTNTINLGRATNIFANVYAQSFQTISDLRFKKNIKALDYGLREIMKMRPVSYNLKKGNDNHMHIGVIAQEIEKIIPEVVTMDEGTEGYKAVDYVMLIPVLVKGMQEMQREIDILTRTVEELKAKQNP